MNPDQLKTYHSLLRTYGDQTALYFKDYLLPNFGSEQAIKMAGSPYIQQAATGGTEAVLSAAAGSTDPKVLSELKAHLASTGQNVFDFSNQVAADPSAFSRTLANTMATQKAQEQTTAQNKAFSDYVAQFQGAGSPWMQLQGMQTQQLQQNLGTVQERARQQLIDTLAARGIDPSALSGAYGGGVAKIGENIGNIMQQGTSDIAQRTLAGITGEAGQLAAGQSGLTSELRGQAYGDIANQLANEYNQRMTDEYYKQMANMQSESPWSAIGSALGGATALIPGVGIPLAGLLSNVGGQVGQAIGGRRSSYTAGR